MISFAVQLITKRFTNGGKMNPMEQITSIRVDKVLSDIYNHYQWQ